jgi:photosystem II stability/assembly factor-like uncharacterized protein
MNASDDENEFTRKRIPITGGSKEIGEAIVNRFCRGVGFLLATASRLGVATIILLVPPALGQTWVPNSLTGSFSWLASSADGAKLLVVGASGIYTSTNYGTTWHSNSMPARCAASSADGSALAASDSSGAIYSSTDYGATWTHQSSLAYGFFHMPVGLAFSADGKKLVALLSSSPVFISTNLGLTWTTNGPVTNWTCVACSADGNKLVATANDAVWRSADGGTNWSSLRPGFSNGDWQAVAMSANGTKVAVAANSIHAIYTSPDSGATWSSNYVNGQYWNAIASSADGTQLAAASSLGIFTSTNSGVTWIHDTAPFLNWFSVAASADGNRFAAVTPLNMANAYTTPAPILSITELRDAVRISWIVPSTNVVLQQRLELVSGGWIAVSNAPTLDLTNLQEELVLPTSPGQGFFRLASP